MEQQQTSDLSFSAPASNNRLTFRNYDTGGFYDELIDEQGRPRAGSELLLQRIEDLPDGELLPTRRRQAFSFHRLFAGIPF